MKDLDALLENQPIAPPTLAGEPTARKCRRHVWSVIVESWIDSDEHDHYRKVWGPCQRCHAPYIEERVKRGKQSRNYGNRAEISAARKYGGTKIGQAGGPTDIRGKDFNTQVKTHRRPVPAEWRKVFGALAASGERCPRLLLRFVGGAGTAPQDFFVFPADEFLNWFGRDEDAS